MKEWTAERIVDEVEDYAEDGFVPSCKEFNDPGNSLPTYSTLNRHIGRLRDLGERSQLEFKERFDKPYSHQEVVEEVTDFSENGELPWRKDFRNQDSLPSYTVINDIFGGLTGLEYFTDLNSSGRASYSLEEKRMQLQDYLFENGGLPTQDELSELEFLGGCSEAKDIQSYHQFLDELGFPVSLVGETWETLSEEDIWRGRYKDETTGEEDPFSDEDLPDYFTP